MPTPPRPRACFEFSEPLARGRVDFAPYVAISGGRGDFAVSAEDRQICVDGLRHGERYGFVIRQGVPSAIPDEKLLKSADYEIYVRDRTPSVRFTGKNYVLPRTGQQGVPVVSVNADRLDLEVMRIGDRNLINSVHSEDFLGQLGAYRSKQIASDKGAERLDRLDGGEVRAEQGRGHRLPGDGGGRRAEARRLCDVRQAGRRARARRSRPMPMATMTTARRARRNGSSSPISA